MRFVANSRNNMSDATKKPAAKKAPADHPKYIDMITAAVGSLKERSGSSRQAILKYIQANYKVSDSASTHVKLALKRGVASGAIAQAKGTGASGSFKLAKKAPAPKKKPAAKKAAKKTPKKPVAVKKTTVKKSPKKTKPAAKKTAAKKATKAKKTPKKAAAKKPAAKKATKAKKTPKKAAKK